MKKQETPKTPKIDGLEPILSYAEVIRITGLSKATIARMRSEKLFPEGIPVGKKKLVWFPSMLVKWQQDMKSAEFKKN